MAELFGIDIAQIITDEIAKAGNLRPGVLTQPTPGTRTPGDLTGGTNPTTINYTFQGFVEEREERRTGQLSVESVSVVTILGASVSSGAIPAVNDSVTIDGTEYLLTKLRNRDPASAVYEFTGDN